MLRTLVDYPTRMQMERFAPPPREFFAKYVVFQVFGGQNPEKYRNFKNRDKNLGGAQSNVQLFNRAITCANTDPNASSFAFARFRAT